MSEAFQPEMNPERRRHSLPRQYLVIALVACGISLLLSPPTFNTPPATGAPGTSNIAPVKNPNELTIKLAHNLGNGEFGVAAKDLKTGEVFSFGDTKVFDAASTMKLVIVSYMYHEASNDKFDLDEMLTIPNDDIQHYGTGTIQNEPGPYRYTYRQLAKLMMEQSDNTAAFVLATRLDRGKLQAFANEQGMTQTSIEQNTTTPHDLVLLLEALNANRLADPGLTRDLFDILDNSAFEDRLPARLPKEAHVWHKTGDANDGGIHDAGIVEYRGHRYAVAIFTRGVADDPAAAKAKIAIASQDIFSYFVR